MNEWLTTGQMIDKLKVGEKAEGKKHDWIVERTESGLTFRDKFGRILSHYGDNGYVVLNQTVFSNKWRILPKYVTFEEAMKALKEGKEVNFIANNNYTYKIVPNMHFKALENDHIHWKDLLEGRWIIKQ